MVDKDPAWIRLRAAAQEDGLDGAALEDMLWLTNLHPELPGFVQDCRTTGMESTQSQTTSPAGSVLRMKLRICCLQSFRC